LAWFSAKVSKPKHGVPLFGHATQLRVFVDPDLLQYDPMDEMCGLQRESGTTCSVLRRQTSCVSLVVSSPTSSAPESCYARDAKHHTNAVPDDVGRVGCAQHQPALNELNRNRQCNKSDENPNYFP